MVIIAFENQSTISRIVIPGRIGIRPRQNEANRIAARVKQSGALFAGNMLLCLPVA
jgi:hypothetical protein